MTKRYNLRELTFLIVEDNSHMRSIIKSLLTGFGVQKIHESNDAADALKIMKASSVDIIVLDYNLPTLDGLEFCLLVRQAKDSPNPYVPIIMLTAHSERKHVLAARDAGVTEFLCKPICAKDLYARIIEIIERPRAFVRSGRYFGPSRRQAPDGFRGSERRKDQKKAATGKNDEAGSNMAEEQTA
jgi:DNA-binding response OmpR family regulator